MKEILQYSNKLKIDKYLINVKLKEARKLWRLKRVTQSNDTRVVILSRNGDQKSSEKVHDKACTSKNIDKRLVLLSRNDEQTSKNKIHGKACTSKEIELNASEDEL